MITKAWKKNKGYLILGSMIALVIVIIGGLFTVYFYMSLRCLGSPIGLFDCYVTVTGFVALWLIAAIFLSDDSTTDFKNLANRITYDLDVAGDE